MNYYIQGNAANADKIKAAFEKLGIDVLDFGFADKTVVYCSIGGACVQSLPYGINLMHILHSHPGYKELELPVQPEFKVGDWIVQNDNGTVSQITKVINDTDEYGEYRAYEHTNGYFAACFENEYHLWTIADAKDGDVLEYGIEVIVIGRDGKVFFGHRPDPKEITMVEGKPYHAKTYDKNGWNWPDIALWLDVEIPDKLIDEITTKWFEENEQRRTNSQ